MKKEREYYPFLDGLRALSILWILAHHLSGSFRFDLILGPIAQYLSQTCLLGFIGIDVFFVISGFLITGLLLNTSYQKPNIKHFYIHRAYKILPQYVLAVLISYSAYRMISQTWIIPPAQDYLLFTQNYTAIYAPLAHLWAVAVEVHFYLLYPLLISFIYRLSLRGTKCRSNPVALKSLDCFATPVARKDDQAVLKNLTLALITLIILCNLLRFYSFPFISPESPWPWQKTHFRFDALLMGGLLKCLASYFKPHMSAALATAIFWIALIGSVILFHSILSMNPASMQPFEYTRTYLAVALLILSCLFKSSFLSHFLSLKPLSFIGKNAYGLYIWHYPILFMFTQIPLPARDSNVLLLLACISLIFLVGCLSTRTLEKYFLDMRKQVLAKSSESNTQEALNAT